MSKKFFLLDGHYLIYRSYHAMKRAGLHDLQGRPTGAIFGLLRFLLKLQEDFAPDYLACALDSKEPTFRHEFFEDYKADRPEMPDDLRVQISRIKEMFELLEIPVFLEPGYESDDLLATTSEMWVETPDTEIIIVSNDKDLFQLVCPNISVLKQSQGLTDFELIGSQQVEEKLGVDPEQVPDYLSLVGDKVDNIPGVKGIGSTYATRLLEEHGTVEEILNNMDKLTDRFREKIESSRDQLEESRELVQLRYDAPIEISREDCEFEAADFGNLVEFCRELDFSGPLDKITELSGREPRTGGREVDWEQLAPAELVDKISESDSAITGYFAPLNRECKPLDTEKALFLWKRKDSVCLAEFEMGEDQGAVFAELIEQLVARKFCTFHVKFLLIWANRRQVETPAFTDLVDLQLASYLLAPDQQHSLPEVIQRETGEKLPDYEEQASRNEKFEWYAGAVELLEELSAELEDRVGTDGQHRLLRELEQPLTGLLARMECNGINIDESELRQFSGELESKLEELCARAHEVAGEEFNLNSPKQLREILFDKLDLSPQGQTDSGKPSTDADSLEALADAHPLPEIILEYRRYKKVNSTYLSPLVEAVNPRTDRVHTEFNQTVAATGRLSSSRPNLQNIPVRDEFGRRVRRAFVPAREDYVFLAADYSQVELRLLAHFSGDQTLMEAFRGSKDIHTLTAVELTDKEPEAIEESDRRIAKVVNYGIAYGLSEFGLARDLDVSQEEAEAYIDDYFNRYPKVKQYIDNTVERAEEVGYVTTIMDRRRYIPQINSDDYFQQQFARRVAVNAPIQGSASDLIKQAMIDLEPELAGFECNLLLQIHDELLLEVKETELESLRELLREVMCEALELEVPLEVAVKSGNNWAQVSK